MLVTERGGVEGSEWLTPSLGGTNSSRKEIYLVLICLLGLVTIVSGRVLRLVVN